MKRYYAAQSLLQTKTSQNNYPLRMFRRVFKMMKPHLFYLEVEI